MEDKIKEKLEKGCGKECAALESVTYEDEDHVERDVDIVTCGETRQKISGETIEFYCEECRLKLRQHEETKKAMTEEFLKKIDELLTPEEIENIWFAIGIGRIKKSINLGDVKESCETFANILKQSIQGE